MTDLAVIIPALNAAATLPGALACVAGFPILVVDGGSTDGTAAIAAAYGADVLTTERGRGLQLRSGGDHAKTDWMLFLHADTLLEESWRASAESFMREPGNDARAAVFRFALDDPSPEARRLERIVAWRGRALGLPYGDQGLLISRRLYEAIGGYRPLPIMEDVDIIRRIGRARLSVLEARAITSAARWQREGWTRRSARNLLCLSLYLAGVPPRHIVKVYGR